MLGRVHEAPQTNQCKSALKRTPLSSFPIKRPVTRKSSQGVISFERRSRASPCEKDIMHRPMVLRSCHLHSHVPVRRSTVRTRLRSTVIRSHPCRTTSLLPVANSHITITNPNASVHPTSACHPLALSSHLSTAHSPTILNVHPSTQPVAPRCYSLWSIHPLSYKCFV